ncbi:MAG: methionine synthase [Synergistaceae bacterium]|nr:methionine synthase [Synergistaceae bacterium]
MRFAPTDKDITDALRYMRVPPAVHDEELIRTVRGGFSVLEGCAECRCVWGRFGVVRVEGGIEVEGAEILSRDIARLTARGDECILLAATLGHEVDRQIALAQRRNMLEGVALDACASVMVDAYIDEYVKGVIVPGLREGERLTHRFSPGYGDLGMGVTEDIIAILNAQKRIGLSVTRSMMMSPIKSVTAIIGLYQTLSVNH